MLRCLFLTHADCNNKTASVGEQLDLTCNIVTCPAGEFQWVSGDQSLDDSDGTLTVDVTTVAEFGGRMYECQCVGMSQCFTILGEFYVT